MEKLVTLRIKTIGSRDTRFTARQYNKHPDLYIQSNPLGLRGGFTPDERVTRLEEIALSDSTKPLKVFEAGFGPAYEAVIMKNRGHYWEGGDVTTYYIDNIKAKGLPAGYFDASEDQIPEGFNALYAHLLLHHLRPKAIAKLMASCRNNLEGPRAFYATILDGRGHEISVRNERIKRFFSYSPQNRLLQICHQEGLIPYPDSGRIERVTAFNNSVFWHIRGRFVPIEEYRGGSYGARDLDPFGDTVWVPSSLCDKDPTDGLIEDQVKVGLLSLATAEFIKERKRDLSNPTITSDERDIKAKEINDAWAQGLVGQEINTVMQHAADRFKQQLPFRKLIESALAVCNNNGFGNVLVGFEEPSWLLEVLSERLKLDLLVPLQVVPSVQWRTESGTHFTGKITGSVFYVDDAVNPKAAVLRHQSNLRKKLTDSPYKRFTVGVGQSAADIDFIGETDYPVLASPSEENNKIAKDKGYFEDRNKKPILVDNHPWNRWKVAKNVLDLIKHLNIVTSDRFPFRPDRSDYVVKRLYWTCPSSHLKKSYYEDSKAPIQISET